MVGSAPQSLDEDRVLALLVEVGEEDGDRLADDPALVGGHAVLPAQGEPRASSAISSSAEM